MTITTPAGWYADPADTAQFRWWSGASWTDHVAPAVAPAAPAALQPYSLAGPSAPTYAVASGQLPDVSAMTRGAKEKLLRRLNPVAYAAMLVAVLSIILRFWGLTSIAAIILSIIGMVRAGQLKRQGHPVTGLGYSVAGLVIGIFFLLVQFVVFVAQVVNSPGFQAGFHAGLTGR